MWSPFFKVFIHFSFRFSLHSSSQRIERTQQILVFLGVRNFVKSINNLFNLRAIIVFHEVKEEIKFWRRCKQSHELGDEQLLFADGEGHVVDDLLLECVDNGQKHLSVKLVYNNRFVVLKIDQTHVSIPLHCIPAFLAEEFLELADAFGRLQALVLLQLKGQFHDIFVEADGLLVAVCDAIERSNWIDIARRWHVVVHVWHLARLHGLEVGTQYHLSELIVIHVLHACQFF